MSNIEHIHIQVKVDKHNIEFEVTHTTGLELKQRGNVPLEYELWQAIPNSTDKKINDIDIVELHSGEKFFSVKPTIDPGVRKCC